MKIARTGEAVPKEFIKALKLEKHRIVEKPKESVDAMILTGNKKGDITQAQRSLEGGQPVFYINTTRSTSALDVLMLTAKNTNTPFYIAYNRRLSPAYKALLGQVQAGNVGKVGFIKIHSNALVPKSYSAGKAKSCATLIANEMIHDIDWLNQHFGPTKKIFCQGTQQSKPTTEYAMASITLKNGIIGQLIHSYQKNVEPSLRVEICGNEGIVQYDSTQETIRQTPRPINSEVNTDGSTKVWAQHWSAFEDIIANGNATKKQTQAFTTPFELAEHAIRSILSGEPKKL
jgi:predicted dehydrogenase